METRKDQNPQSPADWFHPLAGWEVASQWNRATFDWMAKGWQQWVALMTTVPPHFVVPPTVEPHETRAPLAAPERAMARTEPRRIVTRKKPAAKGKAVARKRG